MINPQTKNLTWGFTKYHSSLFQLYIQQPGEKKKKSIFQTHLIIWPPNGPNQRGSHENALSFWESMSSWTLVSNDAHSTFYQYSLTKAIDHSFLWERTETVTTFILTMVLQVLSPQSLA